MKRQVRAKPVIQGFWSLSCYFLVISAYHLIVQLFVSILQPYWKLPLQLLHCQRLQVSISTITFNGGVVGWPWPAPKHPPFTCSFLPWDGEEIEGRWRVMDQWEGLERKPWHCASSVQQGTKYWCTNTGLETNTTHSTMHANMMVKSSPAMLSVNAKILHSYQTIWWTDFICLFLIKLKYTKVIIFIFTFWMTDWKFSKYGISPLEHQSLQGTHTIIAVPLTNVLWKSQEYTEFTKLLNFYYE